MGAAFKWLQPGVYTPVYEVHNVKRCRSFISLHCLTLDSYLQSHWNHSRCQFPLRSIWTLLGPPALRWERHCSHLILQSHSGELINSSSRAVFNYSVKWSVNGQSEIYYIILYISQLSESKPTISGLQWLRSYRITDIWNCIRRLKQHLISSCLLTYRRLELIPGSDTVWHRFSKGHLVKRLKCQSKQDIKGRQIIISNVKVMKMIFHTMMLDPGSFTSRHQHGERLKMWKLLQPWHCGEVIGGAVSSLQGELKAPRLKTAFIAFGPKR